MKHTKPGLAVAVGVAMWLGLSGCGGTKPATETPESSTSGPVEESQRPRAGAGESEDTLPAAKAPSEDDDW